MQKFLKTIWLNTCLALLIASGGVSATEPYLGEVRWVGFDFAPEGWASCDGQLLQISEYGSLFATIGTTFGGNGSSTFGLPDMRGRAMLHAGTGPGLTQRDLADESGAETTTIGILNIPSHTHDLYPGMDGNDVKPNDRIIAPAGRFRIFTAPGSLRSMNSSSILSAGDDQPHNNMQPFVTAHCIIALQGVTPSE